MFKWVTRFKDKKAEGVVAQARAKAEGVVAEALLDAVRIKAESQEEVDRSVSRAVAVVNRDADAKLRVALNAAATSTFEEQIRSLYEGIGVQVSRSNMPPHVIVNTLLLVLDSAVREQRAALKMDI